MSEIRRPICGRILKRIIVRPNPSQKKKVIAHCNKCNVDVEQEV